MQRILFVGGCHVADSGGTGLVEVATKELPHIEVQRLAWVQLKYPDRILNECAKVKPDILILQLGSWETAQGVTRYIRTRLDADFSLRG